MQNVQHWKQWRGMLSSLPSLRNADAFAFLSNAFSLLWYFTALLWLFLPYPCFKIVTLVLFLVAYFFNFVSPCL